MRVQFACAAAALSVAAAGPAAATVFIDVGAGDLQPDENLLFTNSPPVGTTITGVTNQTGTEVSITGGEDLLGTGGQARVEAADGMIGTPLTFDLVDPALAFTSTEFRFFTGGRGTASEVTLTFFDTDGQSFSKTFAVPANGFFNASVGDGELIDYFTLAANGVFHDIRQIRLGGISGAAFVPEPASWAMMILGFGCAGAAMRLRRRTRLA